MNAVNAQLTETPSGSAMESETSVSLVEARLPINAVERETGISKELLRMWERRYGFPAPERDAQGDRIYSPLQINKLRLIRRLLDAGFRPGKIIALDIEQLDGLLATSHSKTAPELPPRLENELLTALRSREPGRVREYLSHHLMRLGLQMFITELMVHANMLVGDAWMRGDIEIYEEHLYTEEVQSLIRQAIGSLRPAGPAPRIMLTTAPEEQHSLGLLMVEALLRLERADAISYGPQMPIREIVLAATRMKMDVVVLSFSGAYPAHQAVEFLEELRFRLPRHVQIWAGGSSFRASRRQIEDVQIQHDLQDIVAALHQWRRVRGILID